MGLQNAQITNGASPHFCKRMAPSNHDESDLRTLVDELTSNRYERIGELPRFVDSLAINYAHVLNFGKVSALEEQLRKSEVGALVMYFDVDATLPVLKGAALPAI